MRIAIRSSMQGLVHLRLTGVQRHLRLVSSIQESATKLNQMIELISPFEATLTFPDDISLDGVDNSLVTITDEVLKRAIAEFTFRWDTDPTTQKRVLSAEARFRKRLFTSKRSKKRTDRTALVFEKDEGVGFTKSLDRYSRRKAYDDKVIDLDGLWSIELRRTFAWSEMQLDSGATITDPGPFVGAFYLFHLDNVGEPDDVAAAGIGINRNLIMDMTGISILRDGFRIRSQGDWLDLSSGSFSRTAMTRSMSVPRLHPLAALIRDAHVARTLAYDRLVAEEIATWAPLEIEWTRESASLDPADRFTEAIRQSSASSFTAPAFAKAWSRWRRAVPDLPQGMHSPQAARVLERRDAWS
jgi:hypothetical protein